MRLRHYEALTSWRSKFCGVGQVWCGVEHAIPDAAGQHSIASTPTGNRFHCLDGRVWTAGTSSAERVALVDRAVLD